MVPVHNSPQSLPTIVEGIQISFGGELFAAEIEAWSDPTAVSFCAGWTSVCTGRERVASSGTVDWNKMGRNGWTGSILWSTCSEELRTALLFPLLPTSYLDDHFNGRLYPGHSKRLRVH